MQPVLEEMRGPHLDFAELKSFALLKKDAASQDMVEVMTVNSLQRKNSFLESACVMVDGKFPPVLHNEMSGNHQGEEKESKSCNNSWNCTNCRYFFLIPL